MTEAQKKAMAARASSTAKAKTAAQPTRKRGETNIKFGVRTQRTAAPGAQRLRGQTGSRVRMTRKAVAGPATRSSRNPYGIPSGRRRDGQMSTDGKRRYDAASKTWKIVR